MIQILIIFFFVALIALFLPARLQKMTGLILASVQLGAFIWFFSLIQHDNLAKTQSFTWVNELNLNLQFKLDSLSLLFALLITGVGFLVFLYAQAYMKKYQDTHKFYFYLFLFSAAMLGLVLSENLIQLFIFWELTSVLSFLLISFFHAKQASRAAAFQALFITGFGGLSLLAGIVVIGSIVDSYSFSDWLKNADVIRDHSYYRTGLALIFLGAFTKSAQFPFHFWLPGAMQAPTPVSAYLHSATMVKAGIYLLVRLSPVLGGTTEWTYIVPLVGSVTMVVGAYFAITQTDLKAILAYTTIAALGILTLLIGIDTRLSIKAALLFLFVHAFYKAALFMIAGFIDKKTGTRDLLQLGNLKKYMPITFIVAVISLLSMAGLPPMLGFIGKELIYEAKIQSPGIASMILVLGVTSNVLMVSVSLYMLFRVFVKNNVSMKIIPNETGVLFHVGPLLLALLSVVLGLFPGYLGDSLIEPALKVVRLETYDVKLKLWHGFNQVFFLSLFTVLMGVIIFLFIYFRDKILYRWRTLNALLFRVPFSKLFSTGIDNFIVLSGKNTRVIQHGYHRYYILTVILFTSIMLAYQLFITRGWELATTLTFKPFYISGLILLIIVATVYSIFAKTRMAVIISMGVVGYGVSLIYLYYSAVDLAITQLVIETLIIVMFVLILQRLPRFLKLSDTKSKIRDLIIAIIFGGTMTIMALKAINIEIQYPISDYFIKNGYAEAYGQNIVNVILVDFRALDTMGEVTVLIIAALGVYFMLNAKKKRV